MTASSALPAPSSSGGTTDIPAVPGPTFLIEPLVLRWMVCFRLREGKWPGQGDSVVWDRDRTGQWRRIENERWKDIGQALLTGTRGLGRLKGYSLSRLRQEHGLSVTLTADRILQWMRAFETKEGRWPTHMDDALWQLDRSQEWIRMPATWRGISACLMCGVADLPPMSLVQFRRAYAQAPAEAAEGEAPETPAALDPHISESAPPLESLQPIESIRVPQAPTLTEPADRQENAQTPKTPPPDASASEAPSVTPKTSIRTVISVKPGLSVEQILQWLKTYRAKEGRWPRARDRDIWAGEQPIWTCVADESWAGIDSALFDGRRGLEAFKGQTLLRFRLSFGLNDDLTEEQLRAWILAYQEKTGRWPAHTAPCVWMRDTAGEWHVVPHESWNGIDDAIRRGSRGLEAFRGSSLSRLRKRLGLDRALTEAQIVKWMQLFREKEGHYPSQYDRTVWIRDAAAGGWRALATETWAGINSALHGGGRGLKALKGNTLVQLRAAHGMIELAQALTEALIVQWIQYFRDKEGRYPGFEDETVWNRHTEGIYEPLANLNWRRIHDALVYRLRGLPEGPGITLERFKQAHQLVEVSPITEGQLQRWIHLYRVRTGRWPQLKSVTVWDRDPVTDQWFAVREYTWARIGSALRYGTCGLTHLRGTTLSRYGHENGLADVELTVEQIVLWMQLFYEKEKHWPKAQDTIVWERNEHDQWVAVPGRYWSTLGTRLRRGDFKSVGRTSLRDLRRVRIQGADDRLTPTTLLRWLKIFHQKEGRWPVTDDRIVWDQGEAGQFHRVEGESWHALSSAIPLGLRGLTALKGSTLIQFRIQHGLVDDRSLTEAQLVKWIQLFHEKEAKWPSIEDREVWERAADGSWVIVANESWEALNSTLRKGTRNLDAFRGQTIAAFRRNHGLCDIELTVERILGWIRLHREKTGNWPQQTSVVVWERTPDQQGWIALESQSWSRLDQALLGGHRGLPGGSSLYKLRRQHGLNDDNELDADRVAQWIQHFHDKEGRWPGNKDPIIWEPAAERGWQEVSGENWRKIDTALTLGLRGLAALKGSSLTKFRYARRLISPGESPPRRWGAGVVHRKRRYAQGRRNPEGMLLEDDSALAQQEKR